MQHYSMRVDGRVLVIKVPSADKCKDDTCAVGHLKRLPCGLIKRQLDFGHLEFRRKSNLARCLIRVQGVDV